MIQSHFPTLKYKNDEMSFSVLSLKVKIFKRKSPLGTKCQWSAEAFLWSGSTENRIRETCIGPILLLQISLHQMKLHVLLNSEMLQYVLKYKQMPTNYKMKQEGLPMTTIAEILELMVLGIRNAVQGDNLAFISFCTELEANRGVSGDASRNSIQFVTVEKLQNRYGRETAETATVKQGGRRPGWATSAPR